MRWRTLLLLALASIPSMANAAPAFAPGSDAVLDTAMRAHDRMLYQFHARPFGVPLTAEYRDADALAKIQAFLAQEASDDVLAVTGSHPYELMTVEGPSGLGLRGGGAVPGTAFRYMALKAEGASAGVLAAARRDVVRAIEALHVVHAVTGVPGRVARGIARITSEESVGPANIPVYTPTLVPLADDQGNPLPAVKNNGTDRADNSHGVLPPGTWFWQDSASKDQLVGWVVAMAALYDAAKGDPDIDPSLVTRMQEDARQIGAMLRERHAMVALDGETYDYDLVIMDADGRPTLHNGLNPLNIDQSAYAPPGIGVANVFNTVMALGIVKGLYHVSGDPEAEAFLYDELMGNRNYLDDLVNPGALDYIYHGTSTNFSDVNMITIALFLNVWYESDAAVLARTRSFMESRWWDVPDVSRSAVHDKQPYFNAFYLAMTDRGANSSLVEQTAALLKAWKLAPYLSPVRINCDEAELAAQECVAVDGTTVLHIGGSGWSDGHPTATEALDPSIRPASNFDARSDPFAVNGGGGQGLNPGGDLQTAYWLLRWLPEPGTGAVSPNAREHRSLPVPDSTEPAPEAVPEGAADAGDEGTGPDAADATGPDSPGNPPDAVVQDHPASTDLPGDGTGPADVSADARADAHPAAKASGGGCSAAPVPFAPATSPLPLTVLAGLLLLALRDRRRTRA